jgi:hypothetical protein
LVRGGSPRKLDGAEHEHVGFRKAVFVGVLPEAIVDGCGSSRKDLSGEQVRHRDAKRLGNGV